MSIQENFQERQMQGEEITEQEIEQLQRKFEIASIHSDMQNLLEAQQRFAILFEDVQKIIYEAVIEN